MYIYICIYTCVYIYKLYIYMCIYINTCIIQCKALSQSSSATDSIRRLTAHLFIHST